MHLLAGPPISRSFDRHGNEYPGLCNLVINKGTSAGAHQAIVLDPAVGGNPLLPIGQCTLTPHATCYQETTS